MKTKFYLLFCALTFLVFISTAQQTSVPGNWLAEAEAVVITQQHSFRSANNKTFTANNQSQRTGFVIDEKGYSATSLVDKWSASFKPHSIGRKKASFRFNSYKGVEVDKTILRQSYGFADIEYVHDRNGLRQNFIVYTKPTGDGDLRVVINITSKSTLRLVNQAHLELHQPGKEEVQLYYSDLKVWDADHQALPAHMELNGNQLSLVVNDSEAVYPITIDPLNHTPEWTTSADGILPALLTNLQLQVATLYGFTVTGLGDINGDGFDDVAVSAPGMADVVAGSGSLLGVGAVFIYAGSASGLSTTPMKVLQPSTGVGALFGYSVAAGDVTGDGVKDILVGAPLDHVAINFGGITGIINASVGKVYVYDGANLTVSNPSPLLSVSLNSSLLTSTTITLNALFGFSVGVADDMNNDGKGEIIVGAPTYARISGLNAIKTGGAFVYLSNPTNTFSTIRSLNPPTGSLLGLSGTIQSLVLALPGGSALWLVAGPLLTPLLDGQIDGLLFGFSVDAAGDYNNDGTKDIVVGAPAGVNLGGLTSSLGLVSTLTNLLSGQILGGSAYVFNGTNAATGVSTSSSARLQAQSTGLLSNAANLFGFKVKGVRNAAGATTGKILIGAPTGGVLSNVVSGLRLKAGQLHVFKQKTSAFTNPVVSDQILSSPRSSSLLSILGGQSLDVSALFAASMDNTADANCDGRSDIIVGEPLSTSVPILGANVTGGAAYMYLERADGTYQGPFWTMTTTVSSLLGINATSLVGFSVAGAGHPNGSSPRSRVIVGGPTNSLDFGSGLLDLGNTVGTLLNFTFDNNGLGKSYVFETDLCGFTTLPTNLLFFRGKKVEDNVMLEWTSMAEPGLNGYQLERSADGVNFTPVAFVFAKGEDKNEYTYPDRDPMPGTNYYRLRMNDNDGRFTYSNVVMIQFNSTKNHGLVITPNPVIDVMKVRMPGVRSGKYQIRLLNSMGQVLMTKMVSTNTDYLSEDIQRPVGTPTGVYWVSIHDENSNRIGTVRLFFGKQ